MSLNNATEFNMTMREIVQALIEAQYDPYVQISGYLKTGDLRYITRHCDARKKVASIDKTQIADFIQQWHKQ